MEPQLTAPLSFEETPEGLLVERICASKHLRRSTRLQHFLRYVCAKAHTGELDAINEQAVGHVVFGRRVDYSPGDDNIVRVEARQLRRRLEDYFSDEGRRESLVLTIPKGGYAPAFFVNPQTAASAEAEGLGYPRLPDAPVDPEATQQEVKSSLRNLRWLLAALSVAVVLLGATSFYLWRRSAPEAAAPSSRHALWSQVFEPNRQTIIVTADSTFVLLRNLSPRPITLDDYMAKRMLPPQESVSPELYADLARIAERRYTSLADVSVTSRILQVNRLNPTRAILRFARDIEIRDLKGNNVVLLGSSTSNPWVELFERELNFHCVYEMDGAVAYFRNVSPMEGEQPTYRARSASALSYEGYAVAAFLPNLSRDGHTLIIEGLSMEGTEAAGEFLATEQLFAGLTERLGVKAGDLLPHFEALLQYRSDGGSSWDTRIVAHRIYGE